jgi:5'(3')-deoxyribonucleotidase
MTPSCERRATPLSERHLDRAEALRIGVDMDGVLTDFNAGWMERYNRDFGTDLRVEQVRRWEGLFELTHFGSMDDFWGWARGDGRSVFRDLPPIDGAVETLQRLARRHRVVIVSSKFDWAVPDSLAWLAEHKVPAREVHFVWRKSRVPCDVYLDDAPHQLAELVSSRPEAVVCRMVRPWNDPLPGTLDVEGWESFEALVDRVVRERRALRGSPGRPDRAMS